MASKLLRSATPSTSRVSGTNPGTEAVTDQLLTLLLAVLQASEGCVVIPTFGLKNSLNVAAAAPVVVFEVLRQWGAMDGGSVGAGDA